LPNGVVRDGERFLGTPVLASPGDDIGCGDAAVSARRNEALGVFLKKCRDRMSPADHGLRAREHRRVPGLRREEVADVAGVSLDYYARLEQGRQVTASPSVLDAIARALRLSDEERAHLYVLAEATSTSSSTAEELDDALGRKVRLVLDALGSTPAIACGAYTDVVAANEAAVYLFTDFEALPVHERNAVRWMLLAPAARELYGADWEKSAGDMVGMLRIDSGRYPGTPRVDEIVAELEKESPLFRRLWSDYRVSAWTGDKKTLLHPEAGVLSFHNASITIDGVPGVTVFLVVPDNPSAFEAALRSCR
jgi:transcriptional regulator with XRE-family HTH domain